MKLDATKKAFYATIGYPVVTVRKVGGYLTELSTTVAGDVRKGYGEAASEGEKVLGKIADQKIVEDITAKVDVDNLQEQVGKLRTQLEDIVKTWRQNFNPEKTVSAAKSVKVEVDEAVETASDKLENAADEVEKAAKSATKNGVEAVEKATGAVSGTSTRKPAAKKPTGASGTGTKKTETGSDSTAA